MPQIGSIINKQPPKKSNPTVTHTLPSNLSVDRKSTAQLTVGLSFPKEKAPAKVKVSVQGVVPKTVTVNTSGAKACAALDGGSVAVTGTCNFSLTLPNLPQPSGIVGDAPPKLKVSFQELDDKDAEKASEDVTLALSYLPADEASADAGGAKGPKTPKPKKDQAQDTAKTTGQEAGKAAAKDTSKDKAASNTAAASAAH